MNERVTRRTKVRVDAIVRRHQMTHEPPCPNQQCVMIHVQKAQLIRLLAGNHKRRVQQFQILVVVMKPHPEQDVKRPFIAPRHLRPPRRLFQRHDLPNKHPEHAHVERRLIRVVRQHEPFRIERLSLRHHARPDEAKHQVRRRRARREREREITDPSLRVDVRQPSGRARVRPFERVRVRRVAVNRERTQRHERETRHVSVCARERRTTRAARVSGVDVAAANG